MPSGGRRAGRLTEASRGATSGLGASRMTLLEVVFGARFSSVRCRPAGGRAGVGCSEVQPMTSIIRRALSVARGKGGKKGAANCRVFATVLDVSLSTLESPANPLLGSTLVGPTLVGPTPRPLGVVILTVSDTRSLETDKSGDALVAFCSSAGHQVVGREILTDDLELIRTRVDEYVRQDGVEVILLTGGTGITTRDVTPEAIFPLFDKEIPGFGELFRYLSYAEIGTATIQSRALAGLIRGVLVFGLPGSTGAVRLATEQILRPQLDIRTKPCNFADLLPRLR
jgi:molybdopterin adenylyltransferase